MAIAISNNYRSRVPGFHADHNRGATGGPMALSSQDNNHETPKHREQQGQHNTGRGEKRSATCGKKKIIVGTNNWVTGRPPTNHTSMRYGGHNSRRKKHTPHRKPMVWDGFDTNRIICWNKIRSSFWSRDNLHQRRLEQR
jgi:hypothetical protein